MSGRPIHSQRPKRPAKAGRRWPALEDGLIARVFACQAVYTLGITAYYEYYPLWLVERVQLGGFGIGS